MNDPGMPADRLDPGRRRGGVLLVAVLLIVITLLHYQTAVHLHEAHGVYRRLYYFPVILAAFAGGWAGGVGAAALACVLYFPHAMGWVGHDPAPALEKTLEMVLYLAVGLVTGLLVSRETRTRRSLMHTTRELRRALDEKARIESELVRQARLAAVGRLSAGLAHEIRNPLASIRGAAEVLQDERSESDPRGRLLRIVVKETARLNNVLTRFLDFARPRAGRRDSFDVSSTLRDVADLIRNQADDRGVTVELDETPGPCLVTGDPEQVQQLVLNVLLNAVEAAGAAPPGRVRASVRTEGDHVVMRIEDDGPGFTSEARENLGTPFFTTKAGGTGLGLAISQRIVEDHAGRLSATDRSEGGTIVSIRLPRASAATASGHPRGDP
ncbi:MAG: ATP-binding protein [Candidatus Krumholzibacteriia bacterium]